MSTAGHPFAVAVTDAAGKKAGPDQNNFVRDAEKENIVNIICIWCSAALYLHRNIVWLQFKNFLC